MSSTKDSEYISPPSIAAALRTLLSEQGHTQRSFARMVGVTPGADNQWLKGTVKPTPMALMAIGKLAGAEEGWWYQQAGADYAQVHDLVGAYKRTYTVDEEENRTILLYGSAGAGPNRFIDEEAEGKISVPRSWFSESQTICGLKVCGDSMAPLIPNGFIVLVDVFDNKNYESLNGKIIACRDDHGVCIKWLREIGGSFYLVSQNMSTEYPPLKVKRGEHAIVGRVVRWIGSVQQ